MTSTTSRLHRTLVPHRSRHFTVADAIRAGDRPVMTQAEITRLNEQIMSMTSVDSVSVVVEHTARVVTRIANDRVLYSDDGDSVNIIISMQSKARSGATIFTNQITETSLRALVHQCESLARAQMGSDEDPIIDMRIEQDAFLPVALWHDTTVQAMTTSRETTVPTLIEGVTRHGLRAAGFVGIMANVEAILMKNGLHSFGEETDSEVTVTARGPDGRSSGWGGQAARDWSKIDAAKVAADAARFCLMSRGAVALEPGRRTAILGPAAVAQLARYLGFHFDARETDDGQTAFSKTEHGGNKLRQRVFDPRIQMISDPADPDGGYKSNMGVLADRKMTWVEDGVLKNLAYGMGYAMERGKPYSSRPYSLRIAGGTSSIEQMIASCAEGIYVNRLSGTDVISGRSGMMTGVTRDGCFLIKNGKIDRPVTNFRILESPFFIFNKLVALGPTGRVAWGYTPPGNPRYDYGGPELAWPRKPMIVPPMMVQDFNFAALADAV